MKYMRSGGGRIVLTGTASAQHGGGRKVLRGGENWVPLKRAGRTEDVARMIVYLLSAGGDYITGQCIAVSGGDWL